MSCPALFLSGSFLWQIIFGGKPALAETSILRDNQNQIGKVGARCPNHQKLIMRF